jgi:hypothetical protein
MTVSFPSLELTLIANSLVFHIFVYNIIISFLIIVFEKLYYSKFMCYCNRTYMNKVIQSLKYWIYKIQSNLIIIINKFVMISLHIKAPFSINPSSDKPNTVSNIFRLNVYFSNYFWLSQFIYKILLNCIFEHKKIRHLDPLY